MSDRMKAADFRDLVAGKIVSGKAKPGRVIVTKVKVNHPKNKYNATPTEVNGVRFDSKREARRWLQLRELEASGRITGLERQVRVYLQGRDDMLRKPSGLPMTCVLDFRYIDRETGKEVYEDAKGYATRDWVVRRAVLGAMGIDVKEV